MSTKTKYSNSIQIGNRSQWLPKTSRKNPKVVLTHSQTHLDILVVKKSYADFSVEDVDLVRHWLQARRTLLALAPGENLPLPGGMFNHIDLSGCHVKDRSGRKHFWDQADPNAAASGLDAEFVGEIERRLRFEISTRQVSFKEGPELYIDASLSKARKMRAVQALEACKAGTVSLIDDTPETLAARPPFQNVAVLELSGSRMLEVNVHPKYFRNLQVRRISWANGKHVVSTFSPTFWWGELDAEEGFKACTPKPYRIRTVNGRNLPQIADAPEWLQSVIESRGFKFFGSEEFAALVYRVKPSTVVRKQSAQGARELVDSTYKKLRNKVAV
jgi:hypothetical protein